MNKIIRTIELIQEELFRVSKKQLEKGINKDEYRNLKENKEMPSWIIISSGETDMRKLQEYSYETDNVRKKKMLSETISAWLDILQLRETKYFNENCIGWRKDLMNEDLNNNGKELNELFSIWKKNIRQGSNQ